MSYNPTSHKATMVEILTRGAQIVCDSDDSLTCETKHLNIVIIKKAAAQTRSGLSDQLLWLADHLLVRPAETKHCLLFIVQPINLHNLSRHTSHQAFTNGYFFFSFSTIKITQAYIIQRCGEILSIDQWNRSPGFLNFRLTNTITWLWRWLPYSLSKCQSQTTVLLRTPITQMIFFNKGIALYNFFLGCG